MSYLHRGKEACPEKLLLSLIGCSILCATWVGPGVCSWKAKIHKVCLYDAIKSSCSSHIVRIWRNNLFGPLPENIHYRYLCPVHRSNRRSPFLPGTVGVITIASPISLVLFLVVLMSLFFRNTGSGRMNYLPLTNCILSSAQLQWQRSVLVQHLT